MYGRGVLTVVRVGVKLSGASGCFNEINNTAIHHVARSMIDHHGRDSRFVIDPLPSWTCSRTLFGEHQQLMEKDNDIVSRGGKGAHARGSDPCWD